jgi:hypothetical protein
MVSLLFAKDGFFPGTARNIGATPGNLISLVDIKNRE